MEEDLEALDELAEGDREEIGRSWESFCEGTELLISGDLSVADDSEGFVASVLALRHYGLSRLAGDHFFRALEESFRKKAVSKFWSNFNSSSDVESTYTSEMLASSQEEILISSVEEICREKFYQEKCLTVFVKLLFSDGSDFASDFGENISTLLSRYRLMVASVLLSTLPRSFLGKLQLYFKERLEEVSDTITGEISDETESNDQVFGQSAGSKINEMIRSIGILVRSLRNLGLASMTEDAYAEAIFYLLKTKVGNLVGDDYPSRVLESTKEWIQAVPLRFLNSLLTYLGDSAGIKHLESGLKYPLAALPTCYPGIDTPSEELVRWQLRLEYFAYEMLQDLRIEKLFEIIVDYPESSPAIEDLKQCLDYTGQHSKLVDSFISSLRFRLLTAGASTNDILLQYISTIKALRVIDPSGVFLEAVVEPIREYLRRRKDTVKCIVTMLTDGSTGDGRTGSTGDSLLEELNKDAENQETGDYEDDDLIITDDRQAWANAMRWEPDPVEADPARGGHRTIDILGMMVSVVGSKEQLVNEHRIMLAEKLLNKSDYDIDSDIRTLELLKIHFGESSMQRCEIMLNDLIASKRTNGNIKLSSAKVPQTGGKHEEDDLPLDVFDATIISSNFWPPIQAETVNVPAAVDGLLSEYARRYHEIKAPRKLLWKKNLGVVKLELQFEDRALQFSVSPVHAAIIMRFQEQASWTSKKLAAAVGTPEDILHRRIRFWVAKGVLVESPGSEIDDRVFTVIDELSETSRNGLARGGAEDHLGNNEEQGETSLASAEELLRKEMTIYEKFIVGMLTNIGCMALDKIHNTLKMFCMGEPSYDKSMQQLQSFLEGLVAEEKIEIRDGMYLLKR